jgi:hypothetical protein
MSKTTLPSGAVLDITLLPFEEAWGVSQIITKEIEKLTLDIKSVDWKEFKMSDALNLKNPICAILSSSAVVDAAKTCFKRVTYNGLKIDSQTFEKREFRSDFLPVVFYVLKENISPFFENLFSSLKAN